MFRKIWYALLACFSWEEIAGECPQLGPLMTRYDVLKTRWGSVYVHHIHRSDESREHMHDHPWDFVSVILRGGYHEEAVWDCNCGPGATHKFKRWFGAGTVLFRPAEWAHRLELPEGKTAWTLVFARPKRRTWGFHTAAGWVSWKRYDYKNLLCPED